MGNRGTFKPLCIRGHVRKGNVDKDGGCLVCQGLLRQGLVKPLGVRGMKKPFCTKGHIREGNIDDGGGCLICWWDTKGIKKEDGSIFQASDYNRVFQIQGGRCKGCRKHQSEYSKTFMTDHDHVTGLFRGLLCHQCNFILGLAKDNPEILRTLADYLGSKS